MGSCWLPYELVGSVMSIDPQMSVSWTKAETALLEARLDNLRLQLRGASRINDLYKYRLSPYAEKRVLAHFNTLEEINSYLDDLENVSVS